MIPAVGVVIGVTARWEISLDIITRKEWGARSPKSKTSTSWSKRTEVVVHYSEGPPSQTPRQIQNFHMDSRGWSDIGYNFLVDTKGRIYEGRGWLVIGAHATGHNTSGIGVCMIGRDGDATDAAKRAIRWLYDEACRRAGRTLAKRGHRDVGSTACPGAELYAWVKKGMPAPGGSSSPAPPPSKPPTAKAPKWPGVYLTQPPMMRHAAARTWQARMRARGWNIAVDGVYGPGSEAVCRAFQKEKRLQVDGVVGPKTWAAAWTAPVT
ncbi:N-acetylmuramoyl-L-alanine amidase [Actinomadura sp. SCN-SB]|uniref:peptidoglycan recognition protein family protein n=1 Tax=Actinomadura sp. SCN-SB TaxID=3373092 RepID=UPI003753431A